MPTLYQDSGLEFIPNNEWLVRMFVALLLERDAKEIRVSPVQLHSVALREDYKDMKIVAHHDRLTDEFVIRLGYKPLGDQDA